MFHFFFLLQFFINTAEHLGMEGERRMSVVEIPGDFLPEGVDKLKVPDGPPEAKISITDNESKNFSKKNNKKIRKLT